MRRLVIVSPSPLDDGNCSKSRRQRHLTLGSYLPGRRQPDHPRFVPPSTMAARSSAISPSIWPDLAKSKFPVQLPQLPLPSAGDLVYIVLLQQTRDLDVGIEYFIFILKISSQVLHIKESWKRNNNKTEGD